MEPPLAVTSKVSATTLHTFSHSIYGHSLLSLTASPCESQTAFLQYKLDSQIMVSTITIVANFLP